MSNFRRNKPKKQPRCTLCTPDKWRGNTKERIKAKDREPELPTHRKRKGSMTRNQEMKSLHQKIDSLSKKRDRMSGMMKVSVRSMWVKMIFDGVDRDLSRMKTRLAELEVGSK